MRQYCKAYRLAELRRFPGWARGARPGGEEPADDAVVYLWDDLTVVADPVTPDSEVLWDAGDDEDWARFCRESLAFSPPADPYDDNEGEPGR